MSRAGNEAYEAACRAAAEIFKSCVSSIEARIAAGEISRDADGYSDELNDAIHQEADDSCIYTSDCWILAYGLSEADVDDLGGFGDVTDINAAITRQAFANLCAALSEHDFDDAFAVAEDQAMESGSEKEVTP